MKCSNIGCPNYDEDAEVPCEDCQRREEMTETPDLREKKKRIERWQRHKNNKKRGEG